MICFSQPLLYYAFMLQVELELTVYMTGLWRLEPTDPSAGSENDGLHPCRQDHRVPVWAAEEMSERRGPVRAQDGGRVRGQAARHQRSAGGGSGLPGPSEGPAVRLQPYGGYLESWTKVSPHKNSPTIFAGGSQMFPHQCTTVDVHSTI